MSGILRAAVEYWLIRDFSIHFSIQHSAFSIAN